MNSNIITPGCMLIAEPFMADEYFKRAVVFMCNHTKDEGSFGYMINKKLTLQIHEVVEGFPLFDAPVFYGGPVESNSLHYIHKIPTLEGAQQITDSIYWSGNYEQLKELIVLGQVKPSEIKFLLGYAGWSASQLQDEVREKSWIIRNSTPELVFEEDFKTVWSTALKQMGGDYKNMALYPENPQLN